MTGEKIPAYLKGEGIVDGGDYEREDDDWFDSDRVAARAILAEQLEHRFERIRERMMEKYRCDEMPRYIGPDGLPYGADGPLEQRPAISEEETA